MSGTNIKAKSDKRVLGVLGGMGPLASAEFLRTIYEYSLGQREQESPIVFLYSDPTIPDRTEALLRGDHDTLINGLTESLSRLFDFGVSKIVICCVTAHYLLEKLPVHLSQRVISLLDVIFAQLAKSPERHLLVCTNGTRQLKIFQNHPSWEMLKDYVVLPNQADQDLIHREIIYGIKNNRRLSQANDLLELLLERYDVESFIAGCTEMHLVAKQFVAAEINQTRFRCLDPLTLLAKDIVKEGI